MNNKAEMFDITIKYYIMKIRRTIRMETYSTFNTQSDI